MSLARELRVKIDARGQVEVDFSGFEGTECLNEARALEEALRQFGVALSRNAIKAKPELSDSRVSTPRRDLQSRRVGENV